MERRPFERLSMFLLVWIGCFLFAALATNLTMIVLFGKEGYKQLTEGTITNSAMVSSLKYLQIASSIISFGLPPVFFILTEKPRKWMFLRLSKRPPMILLALIPIIVGLSFPLIIWTMELNQQMKLPDALHTVEQWMHETEDQTSGLVNQMLVNQTAYQFALNFIIFAIIPAIAEELIFRGALQQLLKDWLQNAHLAIFMTAAVFSFIHFQFFGFLPRMLMGVMLGYLFYLSGNLWLSIFAHFIHNGFQVVLLFLFQRNQISYNVDETQSFPPYITMIATLLLMAAVYIFDLAAQRNEAPGDGKGLG